MLFDLKVSHINVGSATKYVANFLRRSDWSTRRKVWMYSAPAIFAVPSSLHSIILEIALGEVASKQATRVRIVDGFVRGGNVDSSCQSFNAVEEIISGHLCVLGFVGTGIS